jgi:hypothetical protein
MRALSQVDCLALWENGRMLHPLDKGLLAIHAAFPEARDESVADWPLGRRNRALAELYCACFSPSFQGWTECRKCGEKLEFNVDGNALIASCAPQSCSSVQVDGQSFRLPTTRDLALIAGEPDALQASLRLFNQCVVEEARGETTESQAEPQKTTREWTEESIEAIGACMAQADPLAEILLHFDCPACGQSFEENLDLPAFLWSKLESCAMRLMLDIHALASAYGWSEKEILALAPARRDFYLQAVRA